MICLALVAVIIVPALATQGKAGTPSEQVLTVPVPTLAPTVSPRPTESPQLDVELVRAQFPATPFVPTPTPAPTPTPEPLPTMAVRAGDTLVELAQWFDVTPFDIAATNGFAVDDYLQIGETLAIPVSEEAFAMPPDPEEAPAADNTAIAPDEPQPQPTPEPAPVVTPYVPPASSGDVAAAICSLPWPCEQMVRIATCESGLNPNSVNPAGYWGLFQISYQFDGWNDPLTNATVAYEDKYLPAAAAGDPLSPWPVCRYY